MSMYAPEPMGPPGMGAPMGPPPEQAEPQASAEDLVKQSRDLLDRAINADGTVTESERLFFEKVSTLMQQFLAGREKEDNALIGGGPATQALSRAYGG